MKLPLLIRKVSGTSMEPTFFPGQVIVAWRWWRRLRPGDVVIIRHGNLEKIKRIAHIDGELIWLLGDNHRASTDSRHFGAVHHSTIIAKIGMGS